MPLRLRAPSGRSTSVFWRLQRSARLTRSAAHDEPCDGDRGRHRRVLRSGRRSDALGLRPRARPTLAGRAARLRRRAGRTSPSRAGSPAAPCGMSRAQLVPDVHADPDYVQALPGVISELAIPLRAGRVVVGVLNIESERALPDGAAEALRPLVRVLAPLGGSAPREPHARPSGARAALRPSRKPSCTERHRRARGRVASTRPAGRGDADRRLERSRYVDASSPSWTSEDGTRPPLSADEIEAARAQSDPSMVCQVLELERGTARRAAVVWLPLRANAGELGAMVGSQHAVGARRSQRARHRGRPRCACRRVARRGVRAAARTPQRGHGPSHPHPEPARPRGAAGSRDRRGAGAAACR